jgi:hypothetical protein
MNKYQQYTLPDVNVWYLFILLITMAQKTLVQYQPRIDGQLGGSLS